MATNRVIYQPRGRALEYSPLALNIYEGCECKCAFCWVPLVLKKGREAYHETVAPRKDILRRIEKDAAKVDPTLGRVLLCFNCDPYPGIEEELGITRKAIQILKQHGFGFQVLTKHPTRALRDLDLYNPDGDAFAVTLVVPNAEEHAKWTPGADTPEQMIAALKKAHYEGIETWVSLEPTIRPEWSIEIVENTHEYVDLYKVGPMNYKGVLPDDLQKQVQDITNKDWRDFYFEITGLLDNLGKRYYIKKDLLTRVGLAEQE